MSRCIRPRHGSIFEACVLSTLWAARLAGPQLGSISIYVIDNMGMEKRPRRFSLTKAFSEGSRSGGREDCLSTRGSEGEEVDWNKQAPNAKINNAEFRSAEENVSGTALRT